VDCQVKCQSSGYAQCKADLQGGCTAHCTEPSGALFCDGNYVDTGNNLQNCIDALNAYLHVKVDASASGSCSGNECSGQAKASASCAAAPGDAETGAGLVVGALGVVALGVARRRRRAQR
jgi:MYXO-CTERM domain-containing protein